MSKLEIVRAVFEHNEWANVLVLDAAAGLSEDELTKERGPDCGSLQDVLMHILSSHVFMLMVAGQPPLEMAKVEPGKIMAAMRESYDRAHGGIREMVGSLSDESLEEPMTLRNPDQDGGWRTWERARWHVMTSMGTHSMQHRGEAALILTSLGHSPGEIDYSYWNWRTRED